MMLLVLLLLANAEAPPAPEPPAAEPYAVAEATPPRYPLALPETPDFVSPAHPFKLTDLRYRAEDNAATNQQFAARVHAGDWGFVSGEIDGERGTVGFSGQRLRLQAAETDGIYDLSGSYRASRFIAAALVKRLSTDGLDRGWLLQPSVSVRLTSELELTGEATADTRSPFDHTLRSTSLGFFFQRGSALEAEGAWVHERRATEARFENTVDTGRLSVIAQVGPAELRGDGRLDDTDGRFPRQEVEAGLGARVPVGNRLLATGSARGRFEDDLRAHDYRVGLTWFGRHFDLPRHGAAAAQAAALARRATGMGYNERRVFTDDEIREQRERLALSPRRAELEEELVALYHAQVERREVPLLGVELVHSGDRLPGVDTQAIRVLAGAPWPLGWPWHAGEASVPFLRLDLSRERREEAKDFASVSHSIGLTVSFNREMDLVARWTRAESTPYELIRGLGVQHIAEVSFVYAFGR